MEIETAMTESAVDGQITFRGSQGYPVCGCLRSLSVNQIEFELFGPSIPLHRNETLNGVRVVWSGRVFFFNSAVVESIICNGPGVVCQARLTPDQFQPSQISSLQPYASGAKRVVADEFDRAISRWGRTLRIPAYFKEAVEDVRSFLAETWNTLTSVESGIRKDLPPDQQEVALEETAREYALLAGGAFDRLFSKFEEVSARIDPLQYLVAQKICQTHWHPYLMNCPFMHRIFAKPLGYAGDYEMMNMIWRNQPEGRSLFAKVLSAYILNQGPAISVRNRVREVHRLLVQEVMRVKASGRSASIFSVGCGPARELLLLMEDPLCNDNSFHLMDFNDETLLHVQSSLEAARRKHLRTSSFEYSKRSVYQLMRNPSRSVQPELQFDMIYSSGLYDYLDDRVSRTVNGRLYEQLKPGGVLYVTNFDHSNPIRKMMEYAFEWNLIHRNGRQMEEMIPPSVSNEDCSIWADNTGINVFLEIRKPADSR